MKPVRLLMVAVLAACLWLPRPPVTAQEIKPPSAAPAGPANRETSLLGTPASAPASQPETQYELELDLGNKLALKLRLMPEGKFTMGSTDNEKGHVANEGPLHEVTISKPYYMGIHEVTQEQFRAVMGKNPSSFAGDRNPVEMVTWDEAVEFCKKVSDKTGKTCRLPTEAEWEYACRACSSTPWSCGDALDQLKRAAWCNDTARGGAKATTAVGGREPNLFGLYDMHGNVWEWVSDRYDAKYYANSPAADPKGPDSGTQRVLRGGCWSNTAAHCRSAMRLWSSTAYRNHGIGFRIVAEAPK